jgi:hypothetical protein
VSRHFPVPEQNAPLLPTGLRPGCEVMKIQGVEARPCLVHTTAPVKVQGTTSPACDAGAKCTYRYGCPPTIDDCGAWVIGINALHLGWAEWQGCRPPGWSPHAWLIAVIQGSYVLRQPRGVQSVQRSLKPPLPSQAAESATPLAACTQTWVHRCPPTGYPYPPPIRHPLAAAPRRWAPDRGWIRVPGTGYPCRIRGGLQ